MQAALEASALRKQYRNGSVALADVTLTVPHGSITALVGPNAAGKSTLIKSWVAFERPPAGEVRVAGIDPWRNRHAALAHIGYVPQQPALYRGLTIGDHLVWCGGVRPGFDRDAARAYLERLDVPLTARPTALSGGQQAQVMLAIALATSADILLLDEPLASLDPLARHEFLALVGAAVRERGTTALLSSHIVTDIAQVCDRLIVLGVGHVLLDDTVSQAMSTHSILAGPDGPPPGHLRVGHFADDAGATLTLLRDPEVAAKAGPSHSSPPRKASLDEIVKGYLSAGREHRRVGGAR
jgi:ABC-2 type transport system ATP-binding protein